MTSPVFGKESGSKPDFQWLKRLWLTSWCASGDETIRRWISVFHVV